MKLLRTPDDRPVAADAARFARVVVANTGLPTGNQELTQAFLAWQRFAAETENFGFGFIEGQDIEETK